MAKDYKSDDPTTEEYWRERAWIPAAVGQMPVGTEATSRALDAIRAEELGAVFALDDLQPSAWAFGLGVWEVDG